MSGARPTVPAQRGRPPERAPETVLQFGGGNFLRAFADTFIDEANQSRQNVGRVVVVQSTNSARAALLNAQGGRYHVLTRGVERGLRVDRIQEVGSISKALQAEREWAEVLVVARSPELRLVLSNTTEAGLQLEELDTVSPSVSPKSFPAKLASVLHARFQAGGAGLVVVPCELVEDNAAQLLALTQEQARRWRLPAAFQGWLAESCVWLNTLVDRIVTGPPAEHPLLKTDRLLTVAEPYASWSIQADPRAPLFQHPAIARVADVRSCALRKVRILNGAHTALVCKALPMGIQTVREAAEHAEVGPWLRALLEEEIIPTLQGRVSDPEGFAAQTLERLANPFIEHKLASIALQHQAKLKVRLASTRDEYIARFHRRPRLLEEALEAGARGF